MIPSLYVRCSLVPTYFYKRFYLYLLESIRIYLFCIPFLFPSATISFQSWILIWWFFFSIFVLYFMCENWADVYLNGKTRQYLAAIESQTQFPLSWTMIPFKRLIPKIMAVHNRVIIMFTNSQLDWIVFFVFGYPLDRLFDLTSMIENVRQNKCQAPSHTLMMNFMQNSPENGKSCREIRWRSTNRQRWLSCCIYRMSYRLVSRLAHTFTYTSKSFTFKFNMQTSHNFLICILI